MRAHVLWVDEDASRSMLRRMSLVNAGFVVLNASCETRAVELLKAHRVDVVCVDSHSVDPGKPREFGNIKSVTPHIPLVLIHDDGAIPARLEQYADVVIDEPDPDSTTQRLIDVLEQAHFPFCVSRLDDVC